MTDVRPTMEDVVETITALRDVCRESSRANLDSRLAVAQSRRDRRLRATTLRIVRS
jgi:hypothetical protein